MNLTFIQDYSTDITGEYWNQGVHPLINIANLLAFLPYEDFTISDYQAGATYGKFTDDYLVSNLVNENDIIYQSLGDGNIGNTPSSSPSQWLVTNLESVRLKLFLKSIEGNMKKALSLSRRILESQYIYHVGENNKRVLPNDFASWVIEPKGSDYVTIRINELAIQTTAVQGTIVPVYIINQGVLIDTINLTSQGGRLVFESVNKTVSGKGQFRFVFAAQEVLSDAAYNDPLKYDSFVAYPEVGIGTTAETASYSISANGNGLNFNITTYLDSTKYIENNMIDLCDMLVSQFEYDVLRMFLTNANNSSEGRERNITNDERTMRLLGAETLDTQTFTVAQKYKAKLKETKEVINKTLDRFMKVPSKFRVKRRTMG
jgi:hypothetical protein